MVLKTRLVKPTYDARRNGMTFPDGRSTACGGAWRSPLPPGWWMVYLEAVHHRPRGSPEGASDKD